MDLLSPDNIGSIEGEVCGKLSHESPELNDLLDLVNRPYWGRVWVIQELYHAKDHVIRCGSKTVHRDDFEQFIGAMMPPSEPLDKSWAMAMTQSAAVLHYRPWRGTKISEDTCLDRLYRCWGRDLKATDPRDYIYALVSVSSDLVDGRVVSNYSRDTHYAFVQVVRAVDHGDPITAAVLVDFAQRKMGLEVGNDLSRRVSDVTGVSVQTIQQVLEMRAHILGR